LSGDFGAQEEAGGRRNQFHGGRKQFHGGLGWRGCASALPAAAGSAARGSAFPVDNVTLSAKDVANPATVSRQTPSPSATPALPPDLATVKASDPTAADHILLPTARHRDSRGQGSRGRRGELPE